MWQGTETRIEAISREEAMDFLRESVGDYWDFPSDKDLENLKAYGIDLMEETASMLERLDEILG